MPSTDATNNWTPYTWINCTCTTIPTGTMVFYPDEDEVQAQIEREKDIELCPLFHWKELCKSESQLKVEHALKDLLLNPLPF